MIRCIGQARRWTVETSLGRLRQRITGKKINKLRQKMRKRSQGEIGSSSAKRVSKRVSMKRQLLHLTRKKTGDSTWGI